MWLAGAFDEVLKKRAHRLAHTLRMKLNTHDGSIFVFYGFRNAIGRGRCDAERCADLGDRLDVPGVDHQRRRLQDVE